MVDGKLEIIAYDKARRPARATMIIGDSRKQSRHCTEIEAALRGRSALADVRPRRVELALGPVLES